MNYQEKVKEFQLASGQPVSDEPRELTKEEYDFRDNLLREEIRELREAIIDNNRVEILDALCDIKYVNDGTANMMGYKQYDEAYMDYRDINVNDSLESLMSAFEYDGGDFDEYIDDVNHSCIVLTKIFNIPLENFKEALNRVHLSNMSKFCYNQFEIDATIEYYKNKGIEVSPVLREKKTVIYRAEDGKVLKNVNYVPVKLEDLV